MSYGFSPVQGKGMTARLDPRVADLADVTPMGKAATAALMVPRLMRRGANNIDDVDGGLLATVSKASETVDRPSVGKSSIRGAQRKAFPGVYADPVQTAKYMEQMKTAPESPWLGRLFGVSRADLAKAADTPGTAPGVIPNAAANPKGSAAADLIMKPANTMRLRENLEAAREHAPNLFEGMKGWYIMDPAYHRVLELVDGDEIEAARLYTQLNHLSGMASPNADVVTELKRGTAANVLTEQGRFDEFLAHGGKPQAVRREMGLLDDMLSFPGHPTHSTAQAKPMSAYLQSGELQMKSPKVPMYIGASQPTALGRQSDVPVGDAHWSRGVGLADTRNMRKVKGREAIPGQSVSTPELQQLSPWWRDEIAAQAGLEAVPAQAIQWGLLADATGVQTLVGKPKLEILSDLMADTAKRLNISPEEARDRVLLARAQAGYADPKMLAMLIPPAALATLYAAIEGDVAPPDSN